MRSSRQSTKACSMAFSSSRTLPGQSCSIKRGHRLPGTPRHGAPFAIIEALDEKPPPAGGCPPCVPPAAAGDLEHIDAVIEIVPEFLLPDQLAEVAMGGGDDARIGRHGLAGAQRLVDPLLEHAQQAHLDGRGDVADLVQQNRTVLGHGKPALFVLPGIGKGAGLVAEKLGLDQSVGQGAAVDRHEGPPRGGCGGEGRGRPAPCRCRWRPGSARYCRFRPPGAAG
jgi:hypothetical protein